MADRPILFSGPMVRAIIEGRKRHTRRVLEAKPHWEKIPHSATWRFSSGYRTTKANPPWMEVTIPTSYGATQILAHARVLARPGDRLWVREAWRVGKGYDGAAGSGFTSPRVHYEADGPALDWCGRYRHARFMPRWASRITLIVESVKVERLQEISEEDAIAEGVTPGFGGGPIQEDFFCLWNSINGPFAADENPWVVAIAFRVGCGNIDSDKWAAAAASEARP
jgi:hypothetical protein